MNATSSLPSHKVDRHIGERQFCQVTETNRQRQRDLTCFTIPETKYAPCHYSMSSLSHLPKDPNHTKMAGTPIVPTLQTPEVLEQPPRFVSKRHTFQLVASARSKSDAAPAKNEGLCRRIPSECSLPDTEGASRIGACVHTGAGTAAPKPGGIEAATGAVAGARLNPGGGEGPFRGEGSA